jgi:hypothetical protein
LKKKLVPIYSVLVAAIVLLVAFVPSCGGGTGKGTVVVQATLCGAPWQGAANYTLTPTGGSAINGTSVQASFTVDPSSWTCAYVSGGPAGAYFVDITPSATQSLVAGGTITFTLNFELNQDAAIEWITWTVNGVPFVGSEFEAVPCQIIDVHFQQWVDGCEGYNVTVNETSWLHITQTFGPGPVQVLVRSRACAVNKTPTPQGLPPVKKSQYVSFNEEPVLPGQYWPIPPPEEEQPALLDVETTWELVKCLNYTKAINWLGISILGEPSHECVLFELILPTPAIYTFELQASTEVELVGDEDVNPDNNHAIGPPLLLTVNAV